MLRLFCESDIGPFMSLAQEEGWICGKCELDFLLQEFPHGCLVRHEEESVLGYVTSIRHQKSGWIGNLLVSREARRRGIGRELMQGALDALLASGVETVWLTASAKGAGLYQKLGFVSIDSVNRWVGRGSSGPDAFQSAPADWDVMRHVDKSGWGDRRYALLEATCERGRLYCSNHGFLGCQYWDEGVQLGPWGALFEDEAEPLLDLALSGAGERVFLDVPASNLAAAALLAKRGFAIKGSNTLMYLGAEPDYTPSKVFALASMGSMG